jgi:hypothetical protein
MTDSGGGGTRMLRTAFSAMATCARRMYKVSLAQSSSEKSEIQDMYALKVSMPSLQGKAR